MCVQTSWLASSPKEGSPPIWLPGLSLSSPLARADSSSKAHRRSFARSLLAPLRALRYLLFASCFMQPASTPPFPKVWRFHTSTTSPLPSAQTLFVQTSALFNTISASSNQGVPAWGLPFPSPKLNSFTGEPQRTAQMFPFPHSDQRHALSSISSCKVAWLLAQAGDQNLYPLPKEAGSCPGLFHYNPAA